MGEQLLTKAQVADFLHLHPDTIDKIVKRGDITAYKIGNKYCFYPSDVKAYIERQKIPAREVAAPVKVKTKVEYVYTDHYIPGMKVV